MAALDDERVEELGSLEAIYPELASDLDQFTASLELAVTPSKPLLVRFVPQASGPSSIHTYAKAATNGGAYVERDVKLSHLPSLHLQVTLPADYPTDAPPKIRLSAQHAWLPEQKLGELEAEAEKLWEEYGHCQILFAYIDHLQQAAERGFDLDQSADGCLVLPVTSESKLVSFDSDTTLSIFNAGTYDCGICLEPKKGSSCYRMKRCGHVFCLDCLQGFYNNAITEGDVAGIRCLDPTCGKRPATPESSRKRKRKTERTLHPRELLAMGIDEAVVRRYVEMKRKKKLEADKSTVYCPRTWCQGPAKSSKYPPIPKDLLAHAAVELSSDEESDIESVPNMNDSVRSANPKKNDLPPDPADRLAVCEKCSLAFCRVCYMGWHGEFARCFPRDPNELSVEEKASYDYIRLHTSPCPTCSSPTQKTMGCNHMKCFQCNTHFCYLCGAWLEGGNPYQHFNKAGTQCFQRLWELEEGDEGQNPDDGHGFAGGRGWEQMAFDAARDADAQEAAAEAADREAHAEEDAVAQLLHARGPHLAGHGAPIVVHMAHIRLDADPEPRAQQRAARGGRRQRNAFPARPPAQGQQGQAVRDHERAAGRQGRAAAHQNLAAHNGHGRVARRPAVAVVNDEDARQQAELQRFLEMAQRDEEDGWDSDELDEDDGRFEIR